MADHRDDEDVPNLDPLDIQWDQERTSLLRSFAVEMADGTTEHVLAHLWSNESPAGHLNFYVIQPSGRQLIPVSYNCADWKRVIETTPEEVARRIDRIARREVARGRGEKALEQTRRRASSRQVH